MSTNATSGIKVRNFIVDIDYRYQFLFRFSIFQIINIYTIVSIHIIEDLLIFISS